MRSDERFSLFWQRTIQKSDERGIAEPVLPRRRKAPCRFEPGNSTGPGATPDTPEDRYRVLYFETLDVVTTCVKDRFEQEGYKIYKQLEQLLITKGQGNNEELINSMVMTLRERCFRHSFSCSMTTTLLNHV